MSRTSMDMTRGSLKKQILFFSIPLMLSNLLQVLFNMSDIAVIGQFAGAMSLGAVGSTTTLISMYTGFLIGLSGGINVLTALYIGARNRKSVSETVHSAFLVSLVVGLILLILGVSTSRGVLVLLNTKEELIDKAALYDTAEAMELVVKTAPAKFDETVELHVKLGVDSRHADQQVRGAIVLPHGTGKTQRVLVFAKGDKAEAAKAAGADFVGEMDLVEKIQKENWFDFDVVVATPDMMGVVGRLGKVLGPKGLMPSPKAGTVTMDVTKAINEIKAGKVEYRLDKTNIIHCPIGKVSFGAEKLAENFNAIMGAIVKAKPAAAKGQYIKSCVVASTMGPGIKVSTAKMIG